MSFYLYFVHMRRQLKPVSRKKNGMPVHSCQLVQALHASASQVGVWGGLPHCQVRADLFFTLRPTFAFRFRVPPSLMPKYIHILVCGIFYVCTM